MTMTMTTTTTTRRARRIGALGVAASLALSSLALISLAFTSGCARAPKTTTLPVGPATARRPDVPAILVLMPSSSDAATATLRGLTDELAEDFDVVPRILEPGSEAVAIGQAVGEVKPSAVVLMNNPTLRLWRTWRASAAGSSAPPAVAVLTSFLRESSAGIPELTGVVYEVPLVTSLVNLRALLGTKLVRVGVLHRPSFRGFLDEQRRLAAGEGFEIVGVELASETRGAIRRGLERLRSEDRVDAIWVLNDNALLDKELIARGWLEGLRDNKLPVVVNVASLVSRRVEFGTFGVLPDHRALGAQAANLVATLSERGWKTEGVDFELPVSVEKVLDADFARKNLGLGDAQIATVDRVVE